MLLKQRSGYVSLLFKALLQLLIALRIKDIRGLKVSSSPNFVILYSMNSLPTPQELTSLQPLCSLLVSRFPRTLSLLGACSRYFHSWNLVSLSMFLANLLLLLLVFIYNFNVQGLTLTFTKYSNSSSPAPAFWIHHYLFTSNIPNNILIIYCIYGLLTVPFHKAISAMIRRILVLFTVVSQSPRPLPGT